MGSELFPEVPLEEMVDVFDALRKPVKSSDRKSGPYPYYGASGITDYVDSFIFDGEYLLLSEDGDNLRTRNTPIAFMANGKFWVNNHAHILKANQQNNTKHVCYALQIADVTSYISGSTRPKLNQKDMRQIPVYAPPLPEQTAIVHILGSLDDRIELNRRMNGTLEGMAQALFKSWFVDFDPVIDNALAAGNPIPEELADRAEVRRAALADGTANREAAKPFAAAFQQTEELGWIPEGWEVSSFEKLATLDTTSVKPFQQPETLWEHYSIPSFDSSGMPSWENGNEIKSSKYLVKPGAVLSSKLNPETERTWWPFLIDEEKSICSTEFMQFVPLRIEEQAFVYSLIRSQPFQDNILERVTGSTGSRQRAQPKQIAEIDVIDCGDTLRAKYVAIANPMFQSIRNNAIQSRELTKLRDTLLPKLISGELRIPDAEKLAEAALA